MFNLGYGWEMFEFVVCCIDVMEENGFWICVEEINGNCVLNYCFFLDEIEGLMNFE